MSAWKVILDRVRSEPALVVAAVGASLTLLVAFGVSITQVQNAAIIGAVAAFLQLVSGAVTRHQVTPTYPARHGED